MSLLEICSEGQYSLSPAYDRWVWYLVAASSIMLILIILATCTGVKGNIKNVIVRLLGIFRR